MQISDLMGQYSQTTTGTERLAGTKGVENLVSSLRALTKGNIFEGTVSSMKNGQVTLALSNGQLLTARMDGKVSLNVGQSMFFQVKSNDGAQIAIRPFVVDGNGVNYTLLEAMSAAGIPRESKYLSMVNRMMEEQMPIDRASIQQMARVVNANADINVQTLVQMQKIGIPITPENAAQFENYMDDRQAITEELDHFIDELPTAMQSENVPVGQILSTITEGLADVPEGNWQGIMQQMTEANGAIVQEDAVQETVGQEPALQKMAGQDTAQEPVLESEIENSAQQNPVVPHTLGAILEPEQLNHLNQMIGKLLGTETVNYTGNSGAVEVLRDLEQVLNDPLPVEREHLEKLLSSKEFKSLVKDTLEQQWMVKPEALISEGNKIDKLYERLTGQLERIENAMKTTGQEDTTLTQLSADIRNNVEFMNQINQIYTYVQIPLKMSGQNASGQLYVYTNKRALAQQEQDLTAFLHLDMDHLGATDVSVRLHVNEVSTNFYLEDDGAYALIEKNIPVLEARLKKRGYQCSISVINEGKNVNFVEDFLKKDQPSAGQLHRYSFDVRA